jgi:hypothetical protein
MLVFSPSKYICSQKPRRSVAYTQGPLNTYSVNPAICMAIIFHANAQGKNYVRMKPDYTASYPRKELPLRGKLSEYGSKTMFWNPKSGV